MAKPNITIEKLCEILNYNAETGIFTWNVKMGTRGRPGGLAGMLHPTTKYWVICFGGKMYQAHRLAWAYIYGVWPNEDIDHINGIRDCNRISNLRDVSRRTNTENRRKGQGKKSSLMGAHWTPKGGWFSRIKSNGKVFHLGFHKTDQAAHEAYIAAKRIMHEGCTI